MSKSPMSFEKLSLPRPPRVVLPVLAGLLCVLAAQAAKKEPERSWVHPEIQRFVVPRIAVLPAVPLEGGLEVCPFVEKRWLSATTGPRMRWMPAVQSRERLKAGGSDSLLSREALDVLRYGRVDSTTAPLVARALGVRGLLSIRIDLWRRESAGVEGRTRAVVGLTSALVDSTGTLLWTATGRAVYEAPENASEFTGEFGQAPADYDSALVGLVSRWGAIVSATPASAAAAKGP
jgi:hypothetical protein